MTPPTYISAPYIRGASERMSRVLKRFDINLAHKPTRTLKNELCHLKDKRIVNDRSGVVYGLDCNDCSAIYVGETGRQVKDRMKEHQADIIKKKPVSKVYMHTANTGHGFDFDNVKVLDSYSNLRTRRQLESVHYHLQSNSINRAIDLNSLHFAIINNLKVEV